MAEQAEDVLHFWFPPGLDADRARLTRQAEWWFRGGANAEVAARFAPLLEDATQGGLDGWRRTPRSRLALILVLDQFSRCIHGGSAAAYAQDARAREVASEGLEIGHYDALATPFEKTFFQLPFGHAEDLPHLDRSVALTARLAAESPPELRWWLEFSAEQARGHRAVIARFGRHPHRNAVLGRRSTPEELAYLANEQLVHARPLPRVGDEATGETRVAAGAFQVTPAAGEDVSTILALLDDAARWMLARGIDQWRPGMFTRGMVEPRVAAGEAFIARDEAGVVGSFQLHHDDPAVWGAGPPVAFYLHNLVVARRATGRGMGRAFLAWAERNVAARGRPLLRLDCVAANPALCAYYAGAGFADRGDVAAYGLVLRRWEKAVTASAHQR
jgi:uncharacterized protein (DUF924 family)/GNAT superfamily N-acetyltransferase